MGFSTGVTAAIRSPHAVRAVFDCDFSTRLPPWSRLTTDATTVGELRRAATRLGSGSLLVRIVSAAHGVYWPLKATYDATAEAIRRGGRVHAAGGPRRRAQWRDSMVLAHTMNYSPKTYYAFRFWDPTIRPDAASYLQTDELTALLVRTAGDVSVIADKELFAVRCAEQGLPTPPVVAVLHPGRSEQWHDAPGQLPRQDLFVKLVRGAQGRGAELWAYDSVIVRWSRRGTQLDHDEVLGWLRRKRCAVVVQYALANHSDIARFGATLSTFRVMTCRRPGRAADIIAVVLKVARQGAEVDNLVAGGFACSVDIDTGRLGVGFTRDPTEGPVRRHPDSGSVVAGATITSHREVIALATAAHERLAVPSTVGWDIAMTPTGPVLLEGNPWWSVDLLQVPLARGLDSDLANQLLEEVRRAC